MGVKFRRTLVTLAAAAGLLLALPAGAQAEPATTPPVPPPAGPQIVVNPTTSPLTGVRNGLFLNWPVEPAVSFSGTITNCPDGGYWGGGGLTQSGKTFPEFSGGQLGGGEFFCSGGTGSFGATVYGADLKPGKATVGLSVTPQGDGETISATAVVTIPNLPAKPRIDVAPITTKIFQGTPPDGSGPKTKAITSGALITSCKPGTVYRVSAQLNGQIAAASKDYDRPTVNVTCSSKGVAVVARTFYWDDMPTGKAKVLYFLTSPDSPTILAMDNQSVVIPK